MVSTVSSVNLLSGVNNGKSLVFVPAPSWTEPITSPAMAPNMGTPPDACFSRSNQLQLLAYLHAAETLLLRCPYLLPHGGRQLPPEGVSPFFQVSREYGPFEELQLQVSLQQSGSHAFS